MWLNTSSAFLYVSFFLFTSPQCSALVMKAEHQDRCSSLQHNRVPIKPPPPSASHTAPQHSKVISRPDLTHHIHDWPSFRVISEEGGKARESGEGEITSVFWRWAWENRMELATEEGWEAQSHRKPVRWRWSWDNGQTWQHLYCEELKVSPDQNEEFRLSLC